MNLKSVLIANRGEIAIRLAKTASSLNYIVVGLYADFDKDSYHLDFCDVKAKMNGNDLVSTYLNIELIVEIAKQYKVDAIHPGYGFLSENWEFAKHCYDNNIGFIGPHYESIKLMGNKANALSIAKSIGIACLDSYSENEFELKSLKNSLEYPVLIKPSYGGGGKAMVLVERKEEYLDKLDQARKQALNYFGNGDLVVEKYLQNPRHIEIQILIDKFNNAVYFPERECSIQRDYQKIIEETPSPSIDDKLRHYLGELSVKLAKNIQYRNAGTVEFLVDDKGNYYFLEMNTRIQVEHCITEDLMDIDLVQQQFLIFEGAELKLNQYQNLPSKHYIECRINAENPIKDIKASAGNIDIFKIDYPKNQYRIDQAYKSRSKLTSFFDSLIAKLIIGAESRAALIDKTKSVLLNTNIHGVETNIAYLYAILNSDKFANNKISIKFCENNPELKSNQIYSEYSYDNVIYILALHIYLYSVDSKNKRFGNSYRWRVNNEYRYLMDDLVILKELDGGKYKVNNEIVYLSNFQIIENGIVLVVDNKLYKCFISASEERQFRVGNSFVQNDIYLSPRKINFENSIENAKDSSNEFIRSELPGIVRAIYVKNDMICEKGSKMMSYEAMKMENIIYAPYDCKIIKLNVKEEAQISANDILLRIERV
ncbi:MAG: hypothetical protein N4A49_03025 [Marinifilaceae bacterium]|jgi:3-methylcrotonyl-CoA carboxylase alpha subunit|nr:hypothetical protein [Marinifilaceae bacterium]